MGFEGEVARVKEMNFSGWKVALEGLGAGGEEERIIPAPNRKERWFGSAEEFLEFGIQLDVLGVIEEEIELCLVGTGPGEIKVIERAAIRRDEGFIGHAVHVLQFGCLRGQHGAEGIAIGLGGLLPVSADGVPAITEA